MKNKTKIGIVIDSTTTLDKPIIEDFDIRVVSLNIHTASFDKKEVDTTDEEIFAQLHDLKNIKTSSPSPYEFEQAYQSLFESGYDYVVAIPLSKGLSSTYQNAVIAKSAFPEGKVYVADTNTGNYGLANIIESLLFLLEDEKTDFGAFIAALEQRIKTCDLTFTLTELKHLVNGGRLSKIAGLMGAILKIKPMIKFDEMGKLFLSKTELLMSSVINSFTEMVANFAKSYKNVFVKIVDMNKNEVALSIIESLKKLKGNIKISRIRTVRPVFHVHVGKFGFGITATAFN